MLVALVRYGIVRQRHRVCNERNCIRKTARQSAPCPRARPKNNNCCTRHLTGHQAPRTAVDRRFLSIAIPLSLYPMQIVPGLENLLVRIVDLNCGPRVVLASTADLVRNGFPGGSITQLVRAAWPPSVWRWIRGTQPLYRSGSGSSPRTQEANVCHSGSSREVQCLPPGWNGSPPSAGARGIINNRLA